MNAINLGFKIWYSSALIAGLGLTLISSIGLFIVLGIVMYISRKIDWYKPAAQIAGA